MPGSASAPNACVNVKLPIGVADLLSLGLVLRPSDPTCARMAGPTRNHPPPDARRHACSVAVWLEYDVACTVITSVALEVVPPTGSDTPRSTAGAGAGAGAGAACSADVGCAAGAGTAACTDAGGADVVGAVLGWAAADATGAAADTDAEPRDDGVHSGSAAGVDGADEAGPGDGLKADPRPSLDEPTAPLITTTTTAHPATATVDAVVAKNRPQDMGPVCQV